MTPKILVRFHVRVPIMPERLKCLVPFCRCSRGDRKNDPVANVTEWICEKHWKGTTRSWRQRRGLFKRRRRFDLEARMWERLKAQAIERAAGI